MNLFRRRPKGEKMTTPPEVLKVYEADWDALGKKVESGAHSYGSGEQRAETPEVTEGHARVEKTTRAARTADLQEGYDTVQRTAKDAGREARKERGEPTDVPIYIPGSND